MTPSDEAIDQLLERLDELYWMDAPKADVRLAVRKWLTEHSPEASQA